MCHEEALKKTESKQLKTTGHKYTQKKKSYCLSQDS